MAEAGEEMPGIWLLLLEYQRFARVWHSSLHPWINPGRWAWSNAWMLLHLKAQAMQMKTEAEYAQSGGLPGLRHFELINTVLLYSCDLKKISWVPFIPWLKSSCLTSQFDALQIAMSQLPLSCLDFINLCVLLSCPKRFKELKKQNNHSGCKITMS